MEATMDQYVSNTTLDEVASALLAARRIVLTTHAKPDGDALGAVMALGEALEDRGKAVERWLMPPIAPNLRALVDQMPVMLHGAEEDDLPEGEPDRIVIVDTGAWSQLEPMHAWLAARYDRIMVIDHHLRGDDVGAGRLIDAEAAAACEIVARLIDAMDCPYDEVIRRGLYVGIASDTGWFRFSNTRSETHELAARLIRGGVDHAKLFSRLEQHDRPEKLALLIRALDSLRMVAGGQAAVMTLRDSDFADTGALQEETERLVDLPQIVRDVQVVALVVEGDDGRTRLSFRSKPNDAPVDVSDLAREFGGGGHARAAGAKADQPLDAVERRVIEAIERFMT